MMQTTHTTDPQQFHNEPNHFFQFSCCCLSFPYIHLFVPTSYIYNRQILIPPFFFFTILRVRSNFIVQLHTVHWFVDNVLAVLSLKSGLLFPARQRDSGVVSIFLYLTLGKCYNIASNYLPNKCKSGQQIKRDYVFEVLMINLKLPTFAQQYKLRQRLTQHCTHFYLRKDPQ